MNDSELSLPRACLRVGVVGHTDLGDRAKVAGDAVAEVLDALVGGVDAASRRAAGLYRPKPSPCVRVITCLAPGFDRELATRWLARAGAGGDERRVDHAATWVLPGHDEGERAFLQQHDWSPLETSRVRFDLRGEAPRGSAESPSDYEATTRFLVHHSDVLVAFWNGARRRPAGDAGLSLTWLAVSMACERGLPVVWIPSVAEVPPTAESQLERLRSAALRWEARQDPNTAPDWEVALREQLDGLLAPFGDCERLSCPLTTPEAGAHEPLDDDETSLRRVARLLCEPDVPPRRFAALARMWTRFWGWFKVGATRVAAAPDCELWRHYQAVDVRAGIYANLHRGSLLALAALGPAAVALSLVAYALKVAYKSGSHAAYPAAIATVICEIATILLIIGVYREARRRHWHERSVEYRALAESLRQLSWMWTLGQPTLRTPEVPFRARTREPLDWTSWYRDSLVRAIDPGSPGSTSGATEGARLVSRAAFLARGEHALQNWLVDQFCYYRRSAPSYARLHHVVESAQQWVIRLVLFAAVASIVALAIPWKPLAKLTIPAVFVGVVGPALAAALHSLASHLETERLANNYRQMSRDMLRRARRFKACMADTGSSDLALLRALEDEATGASRAMLAEVDDWHAATSNHPPVMG